MRQPRNYTALHETENKVNEAQGAPLAEAQVQSTAEAPTVEYVSEIDRVEARLAEHDAMLQEKVDARLITASEKVYQMRKFDNHLYVEMKQADLQDLRDLAAEARAEEAGQQKGRDLEGPER